MSMDEKYIVGIYVRESRDENGENYETIETQRDLLVDFVNRSKLGKIYKIYMDDNASGAAFNRAGIEALKEDVTGSVINMIILKDLSRLGRNNAKTLLFLDFLEENGIRVMTFDGRYDSLKDNDTVGIETWFNERYIRDISKKIRTNLKFKIQKGEFLGKAPYGYRKSESCKNSLVVDDAEARVVKKIFEMYAEGYGYRSIANYLNDKEYCPPGYKLKTGYVKWNPAAIGRILSNRVYTGDTVQGVSEKISFKSKKTRRLPQDKWVVTQNTHQPIIGKDEFEKIQILVHSRTTRPHKKELHLFKGLIYCGECGSLLYARTRKDRPLGYVCGSYAKNGKSVCSSHFIREDELVNVIYEEIIKLFTDRGLVEKVNASINKAREYDCSSTYMSLSKLEQLIKTKRKQQDILYTDRLEGRISQQLFERMNSNLEKSIELVERDIAFAHKKACTVNNQDAIMEALDIFKNTGLKRDIIKLAVEKITVFDNQTGISDENDDIKKKPTSTNTVQIDFSF